MLVIIKVYKLLAIIDQHITYFSKHDYIHINNKNNYSVCQSQLRIPNFFEGLNIFGMSLQ